MGDYVDGRKLISTYWVLFTFTCFISTAGSVLTFCHYEKIPGISDLTRRKVLWCLMASEASVRVWPAALSPGPWQGKLLASWWPGSAERKGKWFGDRIWYPRACLFCQPGHWVREGRPHPASTASGLEQLTIAVGVQVAWEAGSFVI